MPKVDWDKPNWGEFGQNIHYTIVDQNDVDHDHCRKHCKCTRCRERREDA